jgi:hypothetical protein
MVKYTDDLRFPDKKEQKNRIQILMKNLTDTKIVG